MSIQIKSYNREYPVNKTIPKKSIIHKKQKKEKLGVSIITVTNNEFFIENIFKNFNRQDYQNKELIIILNRDSLNLSMYEVIAKTYDNIRVYRLDGSISLGYCLNYAVSISKYSIVAKFDDDDYYGPNYLSTSVEAFKFTDADVVGKSSHLVYFEQSKLLAIRNPNSENKYVRFINGSTILFNKRIFNKIKFANISIGEDTQFCRNCMKKGIKIYSTDRYYHVYIRRISKRSHTWKVSDKTLLHYHCKPIMRTDDYKKYADKIENV